MSDITGIHEPRYQYCDGGRAAAGFPPLTDAVRGDCATRGIAIAARLEYEVVSFFVEFEVAVPHLRLA